MSLVSEVQARIPDQRLVELTNPDDRDATTPNPDRLTSAADDIANAWFPRYTGVAYDNTDAAHVAVAVEGVEALLVKRNGQTGARDIWNDWTSSASAWGQIQGRNRIVPITTSQMTPSKDNRLTSTPRPAFDDRRWDNFLPNSPAGGTGAVEEFG